MLYLYGQGGLSQSEQFADMGGFNFSRFCADVFYGRPLSTLTYINWGEMNLKSLHIIKNLSTQDRK